MKKIYLLLGILLSMGSSSIAQKVEIGERNDFIRYEGSLLGMDKNNYYVLVGYSYNKKDNYKGTVLYTYDKNLKIVDKTNIDGEQREVATDAFVTDRKLSMIHADYQLGVMDCHVIDKTTKQCVTKKYFHDELSRKERAFLYTCKSPDDSLFFAMKTIFNRKDENIKSSKMVLFDNEMNELWQKDYFVPMSSMFLTNDGEVMSVGYYVDDNGGTTVRFSVITGEDEMYIDETISDLKIGDLKIANSNSGELLMYGLMEVDNKRGNDNSRNYYNGFFSFTYNLKTRAISNVNKYIFTDDDYRIIMNLKADKKVNYENVSFLKPLEVLPTSDGGVVVSYCADYETIVKSQYGISKYKNKESILLWRLRSDGSIVWHNGFRRIMLTGMFENSWYTPHYITDNDEVVFVVENSTKDKLDNESPVTIVGKSYMYEYNKAPAKLPTCITLVRFDKDGNISKEVVHSEKKMLIVGKSDVLDNGKAVLLYVSNKKAPGGLIRVDVK